MPKMDLKMIIEEKDNPDSNIKRVVKVINTDSSLKIEVAQDTHMEVKEATTGSIVIHLCPLTDNAVHRFLGKDGSIIQNMIEKLFTSAGLDKLLKKRRELEIVVKVIKKDPSPDEKGTVYPVVLCFTSKNFCSFHRLLKQIYYSNNFYH